MKHEIQLPQHEQELGEGKTRWLGLGGSVDIDEGSFTLGLGLRAEPDLKHGVSHACDTFGTSGPLTPEPTFEIDALEVWAADGVVSRTLRQRAAAEAGMMDRIGGAGGSASADVEQTAMLEMVGRERLAGTEQRLEPEQRPPTEQEQALDRECGLDA